MCEHTQYIQKLTAQKVPFPNRPKQKYLSLIIDPGSGNGGWVDRLVIVVASAIVNITWTYELWIDR